MRSLLALTVVLLGFATLLHAETIEWTPEANMDHQLFPSLIIATASVRPVEPEDEEAAKPDPLPIPYSAAK